MGEMYKRYIIYFFTVLLCTCCNKLSDNKVKHEGVTDLFILFQSATIIVRNYEDSIQLESWDKRDSVTTNGIYYIPVNLEKRSSSLSKIEKDSISSWVQKLASYPVKPAKFCTDYVGYVKFVVRYSSQVEQSCKYTSVCEWDSLSNETIKLNKLIKKKFGDF